MSASDKEKARELVDAFGNRRFAVGILDEMGTHEEYEEVAGEATVFRDALLSFVDSLIDERDEWQASNEITREVMTKEIAALLRLAVTDTGKMPAFHDAVEKRHREEWPTLWKAIDRLLAATEGATK